MKNIKFVIILLLVSVIFISGCAQSDDTSTTKEIKAKKKLTIVSYCKSTGEPPPCAANDTIVNETIESTPTPTATTSLPPILPSSSATPTTSLPPVLPSSSATPTTSLPPILPSASPTSDCIVTYTPPKESWTYGPCVNGQKARLTEVSYSYKGSTCKLSEIIPKTSEPCTPDPTTSATPTPSTTTSTSPSPTPTDNNPTPTASASPTTSPCNLATYGDPCTTYFYEQRYVCKNSQPMRQRCQKVWDTSSPCYHQKFFEDYPDSTTCTYGCCQTQPGAVTRDQASYPNPADAAQYACKTSESDTC